MGNFVADLAHGEEGEDRIRQLLATAYPACNWIKATKGSKYLDCICNHCGATVEIKTDRKAAETGNLCFEANLFKHTRAEKVFYLVGDRAFAWPVEDLKLQLLLLHAQGKTRGLLGGDGWKNPLILAPVELITETAEVFELEAAV